jgi:hypothetical protein
VTIHRTSRNHRKGHCVLDPAAEFRAVPGKASSPGSVPWPQAAPTATTATAGKGGSPCADTQFNEGNATFSPNRGWVTYVSDKSGEFQIYVRPFPGPGEEWQVSSGIAAQVGGGSSIALKWRADGKEAFYLSADWQVMSIPVTTTPRLRTGVPRPLFAVPPGSQFDVTADGQRFLVNALLQNSESLPLNVVLNWNSTHAPK